MGVSGFDEDADVYIARDGREDALEDNGDGSVDFEFSLQLGVGISTILKRCDRDCTSGYD